MQLSNGSILGSYRIEEFIASGGMGEVYKARHTQLERWVAIKVIREKIADDPRTLERFHREAKSASRLEHPNICRVYNFGQEGDRSFLVLEYLEGETLAARLARERGSLAEAMLWGADIAEALDHAHGHGLVHRDLKPSNVMLTKSGVKILDFGVAKRTDPSELSSWSQEMENLLESGTFTREGFVVGTLPYMAPEQIVGGGSDARADIYALGVMLYEVITGRPPFTGRTQAALAIATLRDTPPPIKDLVPSTPAPLIRAVDRCLEKDPDDRWQNAREFATELTSITDSKGERLLGRGTAKKPSPARFWMRVGGALTLAVAAVTLAVNLVGRDPGPGFEGRPKSGDSEVLPFTRIAVLPFEAVSGQTTDLQDKADGFTRTLINELSQVEILDLLSWPAVRPYRESTVPLPVIVAALGAGTLVDGRVEEVPPDRHLRVRITITDGATQSVIDSKTIEWSAGELIELQDSIVTEVARFLRERVGQAIHRSDRRAGTDVDAAWASVQVGERASENGAGLASTGEARAARSEFARADSLFHLAETLDDGWLEPVVLRGWLALEQQAAPRGSSGAAEPDWLEVAGEHAGRALDRAPADPQALELRGTVRFRVWETPGLEKPPTLLGDAESDLRAALGSHRAPARTLSTLSRLLWRKGDLAEAKRMATRAFDDDPFLAQARTVLEVLAQTSLELEQVADAMRWCNEGRERYPEWRKFISCAMTTLAASERLEPNVDTIWAMAEDLVEASPPNVLRELNRSMAHFLVARLLARAELPDSAGHVLDRALSYVPDHPQAFMLKYHEAGAWLQLGRTEDALRAVELLLERVPERREYYANDWWFRGLWSDPRFQALVATPPVQPGSGSG